jgi:signal transduction histidine kinase/ActR/RegA family two-component response regulator
MCRGVIGLGVALGVLGSALAVWGAIAPARVHALLAGVLGVLFLVWAGLLVRAANRSACVMRERATSLEGLVAARTEELRESEERSRHAAEQALAANRTKDYFLANMSHEIRTPMTAIIGYADLLLDPSCSTAARAQYVQTIKRNGESLLSIINDILDFSKLDRSELHLEPVPGAPAKPLEDTFRAMSMRASSRGLALRLRREGTLPELVKIDALRVRQILGILAGNAIKFTSSGSVELSVSYQSEPRLLRYHVTDTGRGIEPERLATLFEAFTQGDESATRAHGGVGLGLTIARRLARLMNGDISVQSRPGRGSTFTLELDPGVVVMGLLAPAGESVVPTPQSPLTDARILLAEDGVDNQRLISHYLRKAGALVEFAGDGKLALSKAGAELSRGAPYDLILMDMQMREMDGYEATRALREVGYMGPIVALTAHALAGDREKCLDAGCEEHLTKPVEKQRFLEVCAAWIAKGRAHATPAERRAA